MPKSDFQKMKILYIRDYLEQYSSENHPVSSGELIQMLEQKGICVERKSIYSDIAALQDYGLDILKKPGKSGGYYLASRTFELPELKLLINAVQSSRYLTEEKSRELIGKLGTLCSEQEARQLRNNVMVSGRVKSMNETIYYNVDAIQEAISAGRQIAFRYFDWGVDGQRHYREKPYTGISPYGLCQDNENCYLLARSPRHGVTTYRVDRMDKIRMLDAAREPCPELTGEKLYAYASKQFQMYSGEATQVRLRFANTLINPVVDKFGHDCIFVPDDDPDGKKYFVLTVNIGVSPMFYAWVFGFGTDAQILSPQWVQQDFRDYCRNTMAQYDTAEKD